MQRRWADSLRIITAVSRSTSLDSVGTERPLQGIVKLCQCSYWLHSRCCLGGPRLPTCVDSSDDIMSDMCRFHARIYQPDDVAGDFLEELRILDTLRTSSRKQ